MSTGPAVATATVRIVPDTTGFRAELQKQLAAATAGVTASVNATLGAAGAAAGAGAGKSVGGAGGKAAAGIKAATAESNALRGAIVGLSRATPVTVFGLGVAGTAAIAMGYAMKGAIRSTADFEHQLYVFQATTNATAAEMDAIAAKAKELGSDLSLPSTSAGDAALAMTELAKAGLSVNDTLAGSTGVLQLAAAAQLDVGTAAQFVATQLNAFGLAGDQATHIADLLAGASIAAQGDIRDFGTAFQQVSAVSRQTGLDVENTTGALTELARAGLRGADAGTSLRTFLLRLTPTTKQAQQYMDALGISYDKTKTVGSQLGSILDQLQASTSSLNEAQKTQALTQIFGQDAIRSASILVREGSAGLRENTEAANQNGAASRLAEANAKGLSGAFNGLKSNLDTLGITLGQFVVGPLTSLTKGLADAAGVATKLAEVLGKLGGLKVLGIDLGAKFKTLGTLSAEALIPGLGPFLQAKTIFGDIFKGSGQTLEEKVQAAFEKELAGGASNIGVQRGSRGDRARRGQRGDLRQTPAEAAATRARIKALEADKKARKALPGDTQPTNKLEIAQLNAQLSGSLQAELKADKDIEGYFEKRLKLAKKGTDRYVLILGALQSAHAASVSVQGQINSLAKADAAEAKANREKAKRLAEQKAEDAAQAAKDLLSLQFSALDLAIKQADLTESKLDDVQKRRNKIKAIDRRIAFLNHLAKKTTEEKQEIINLKSARTDLLLEIKGLKDDTKGSGFSLQDFFQESVNQLNQFGSNVSTGVTLGGGARAALAGSFLASQSNLSEADKKKLLATATTNELLAEMLAEIRNNQWRGGDAAPVGGKGTVKDTVWHHYPPSPSTTRAGVHN